MSPRGREQKRRSAVISRTSECFDGVGEGGLFLFGFGLASLFAQHRAAAEADLVAFQRQALDQNLITELEFVTHLTNAVFRQFR